MKMKKYELTNETKKTGTGDTVYRIRALRSWKVQGRLVKKGIIGGWVQSEGNLSHDGGCWLFDEAMGYQNSRRSEDSIGYGNSKQYGNSEQYGHLKHISSGQFLPEPICMGPFGLSLRYISIQPDLSIVAGCFHGDFETFRTRVEEKYGPDYGSYSPLIKILKALCEV